jgi:hypothetical protein
MPRILVIVALGSVLFVWQASVAQPPSFDKLSDQDRQILQRRFEKEIWPLMQREGKKGCMGCHAGGQVTALRLTGELSKDFPMLVREGFFIPDDAGSLLGRVTDPDPERRMPRKGKPWTDAEVQTLKTFVVDLNKKQKN